MLPKKLMTAITAIVFAMGAQMASAQNSLPATTATATETVAHGGGCRKDSPPGQCCHAGSKPFHCH